MLVVQSIDGLVMSMREESMHTLVAITPTYYHC